MDRPEQNQEMSQPEPAKPKSFFDSLPSYPDEDHNISVPARQFPVVELCAGALIGVTFGLAIGWFIPLAPDFQFLLISTAFGLGIGILIGIGVGHFTGPTSKFSVGTVLAAIPRVLFGATLGLLFGIVFAIIGVLVIPTRGNDDS